MAVSTEQVFIEVQADLSQVETAIDTLTKLGLVDRKVADEFKATTTQLNNQSTALKAATANTAPLHKGLEGLVDMSKKVGATFQSEFLDEFMAGLQASGVDLEEFNARLSSLKGNDAFEKLQTDLVDTSVRIAETIAKMEALKHSGGTVEALDDLAKQLKADEVLLDKFSAEFREALDIKPPVIPPIDPDPKDEVPKDKENVVSLRQELKNLTQAIALAKANGTAFGEEYEKMRERAGVLKDALADANAEIKATGSDTRNVEGLISIAGGVAGGFAIAQGSMALFGDESEELQKTLLKVNAVMAILQGLQQIQNVLQKESAAAQLVNRAATLSNALAHRIFGASIAGSSAALKLFRVALAATGIGAVLLLIGLLVEHWDDLKESISGVSEEQRQLELNAGLNAEAAEQQLEAMEGQEEVLKRQGKSEAEILKAKVEQVNQVIAYREQQLQAQMETARAQVEASQRNKEILSGIINFITIPLKGLFEAVNRIAEFLGSDFRLPDIGDSLSSLIFDPDEVREEAEKTMAETQKSIDALKNQRAGFENNLTELAKAAHEQRLKNAVSAAEREALAAEAGTQAELDAKKKLLIAQAEVDKFGEKSVEKRRLIEAQLQKDLLAAETEFNKARIEERVAALNNELLLVEEGSREELALRLKLLDEQKKAELADLTLTAAQRANIEKNYFNQSLVLRRDFNKKLSAEALQEEIARNNAALDNQRLNFEDRLNLTVANIEAQAELEVQGANGNAALIKAIYAKRDKDIRDFKKQMIDDAVEYEISLATANEGPQRRAQQRILDNDKRSLSERINASRVLNDMELANIDARIASEIEKEQQGLFKTEEERKAHNLRMAELEDQRLEKTEEQLQEETDMRKAEFQKWFDFAIEQLNTVASIASTLVDIQNQQDQDRIAQMRQSLEDAKESGSITEKEAIARAKRIDAEERRLKQKAAERERTVALFQAIINGAAAVVKALSTGGPVAAAIVGALAAVQIAIIATRPLPKFAKGKRREETLGANTLAEVAEVGPEIIERDGRMVLVPKRTITWVGAKDIVYNAADTRKILDKAGHRVDTKVMNHYGNNNNFSIDYSRMERIFRKHSKGVNISIQKDFIEESVANGFSKTRYLNNRYSFR